MIAEFELESYPAKPFLIIATILVFFIVTPFSIPTEKSFALIQGYYVTENRNL